MSNLPFITWTEDFQPSVSGIQIIPFVDIVPCGAFPLWIESFFIEDGFTVAGSQAARRETYQLLADGRPVGIWPIFPNVPSINGTTDVTLQNADQPRTGLLQLDTRHENWSVRPGALLELRVIRLVSNAHRVKGLITGSFH